MAKKVKLQEKLKKSDRKKRNKTEQTKSIENEVLDHLPDISDDDAPEDMTFTAGKEKVFSIAKEISSQIKKTKADLKEKRKHQHDENKKQKKKHKKVHENEENIENDDATVQRPRKEMTAEDVEKKKKAKTRIGIESSSRGVSRADSSGGLEPAV
jgi:DNA polymerase III gamma/tau subunit